MSPSAGTPSTQRRLWLACYDIRDARRLRRVAKVMERFGTRAQKSVFECWLTEQSLRELCEAARAEMDPRVDSLRLYTLCETCILVSEDAGDTPIQRIQQYYIV